MIATTLHTGRVRFGLICAACALAITALPCLAQAPAKRPIRILVASAPAETSDTQIRLLLPAMAAALGQPLIVDNRTSTDGAPASALAARAAPDGHTLMVGDSGTHALNAAIDPRLAYDPIRDFAAISQLSLSGFIVAGHPRLAGAAISDLAAYAKPTHGKLTVGIGSLTGEMAGNALWARLGIKPANVAHTASLRTTMALVAGAVDLSLLPPADARAHVHAGRLKAFGITSAERSPVLPEVPTMMEQGLHAYEFSVWSGLFAPANTPKVAVNAVYQSVVRALGTRAARERFEELGIVPVGNTPDEFTSVVKRDLEKFRKLAAAGDMTSR
jgi:tripartite-type tricarboxylate transporter receptor subunit TctC